MLKLSLDALSQKIELKHDAPLVNLECVKDSPLEMLVKKEFKHSAYTTSLCFPFKSYLEFLQSKSHFFLDDLKNLSLENQHYVVENKMDFKYNEINFAPVSMPVTSLPLVAVDHATLNNVTHDVMQNMFHFRALIELFSQVDNNLLDTSASLIGVITAHCNNVVWRLYTDWVADHLKLRIVDPFVGPVSIVGIWGVNVPGNYIDIPALLVALGVADTTRYFLSMPSLVPGVDTNTVAQMIALIQGWNYVVDGLIGIDAAAFVDHYLSKFYFIKQNDLVMNAKYNLSGMFSNLDSFNKDGNLIELQKYNKESNKWLLEVARSMLKGSILSDEGRKTWNFEMMLLKVLFYLHNAKFAQSSDDKRNVLFYGGTDLLMGANVTNFYNPMRFTTADGSSIISCSFTDIPGYLEKVALNPTEKNIVYIPVKDSEMTRNMLAAKILLTCPYPMIVYAKDVLAVNVRVGGISDYLYNYLIDNNTIIPKIVFVCQNWNGNLKIPGFYGPIYKNIEYDFSLFGPRDNFFDLTNFIPAMMQILTDLNYQCNGEEVSRVTKVFESCLFGFRPFPVRNIGVDALPFTVSNGAIHANTIIDINSTFNRWGVCPTTDHGNVGSDPTFFLSFSNYVGWPLLHFGLMVPASKDTTLLASMINNESLYQLDTYMLNCFGELQNLFSLIYSIDVNTLLSARSLVILRKNNYFMAHFFLCGLLSFKNNMINNTLLRCQFGIAMVNNVKYPIALSTGSISYFPVKKDVKMKVVNNTLISLTSTVKDDIKLILNNFYAVMPGIPSACTCYHTLGNFNYGIPYLTFGQINSILNVNHTNNVISNIPFIICPFTNLATPDDDNASIDLSYINLTFAGAQDFTKILYREPIPVRSKSLTYQSSQSSDEIGFF